MKVIFAKNYLKDLYERGYPSDICQITINNKTMIEIPGIDPQMIANNLKPDFAFHPGEIIMDELEYLNITQKEFAQRICVSCSLVNQILRGKRAVNVEFALLTEAALGLPSHMLLRMQNQYDIWKAEHKAPFMEKLKKVKKFAAAL